MTYNDFFSSPKALWNLFVTHQNSDVMAVVVGQRSVARQQMALASLVDVVEGGVERQLAAELAAKNGRQGAASGRQRSALLILQEQKDKVAERSR